jgi:hypothetical protein
LTKEKASGIVVSRDTGKHGMIRGLLLLIVIAAALTGILLTDSCGPGNAKPKAEQVISSPSVGEDADTSTDDSQQGAEENETVVLSDIAATPVSTSEARITWKTDVVATSWVQYGTTVDYERAPVSDFFRTTHHEVTLDGLESDTEYHFRVGAGGNTGNTYWSGDATFIIAGAISPEVADFDITSLVVEPAEAHFWEEVSVSVKITNVGEAAGIHTVVLGVDGVEEGCQEVAVAAGETEEVTFALSLDLEDAGSEKILQVDGNSALLRVKDPWTKSSYNLGDKWVSRITFLGLEYEAITEVIGESTIDGKDCYVLWISSLSSSPPLEWAVYMDKATMTPVSLDLSGEVSDPWVDFVRIGYDTNLATSVAFLQGTPYPVCLGNSVQAECTMTGDIDFPLLPSSFNETFVCDAVVESMDTCTVAAGTFECLRIVVTRDDGVHLGTIWVSQAVGPWPVLIQGNYAVTGFLDLPFSMELLSYSPASLG